VICVVVAGRQTRRAETPLFAKSLPCLIGRGACSTRPLALDPFSDRKREENPCGDRRSTGNADLMAALVIKQPEHFAELWACLKNDNSIVRMRAADALEKVTRASARDLQSHKMDLLSQQLDDGTKEVRWHLLAMCSRLQLAEVEASQLMDHLNHCLQIGRSNIVRVTALQAAFEINQCHAFLRSILSEMLSYAKNSGIPSLNSRARKLTGQMTASRI